MEYLPAEVISLKNSSIYNEKWLQAIIETNPSILGLGELEFRYTEKVLIGGGRLGRVEHSQIVSVSAMVEGSTRPSD